MIGFRNARQQQDGDDDKRSIVATEMANSSDAIGRRTSARQDAPAYSGWDVSFVNNNDDRSNFKSFDRLHMFLVLIIVLLGISKHQSRRVTRRSGNVPTGRITVPLGSDGNHDIVHHNYDIIANRRTATTNCIHSTVGGISLLGSNGDNIVGSVINTSRNSIDSFLSTSTRHDWIDGDRDSIGNFSITSTSAVTRSTTGRRSNIVNGNNSCGTSHRRRRSRRSSTSTIHTFDTSISSPVNEKMNAFIEFLKPIVKHLEDNNMCYTYQIQNKANLHHKDIGTLSALLGFSTDDKTDHFLSSIGLLRKANFRYGLNIANWEIVERNIIGFTMHNKFGKQKHQLFTIGKLSTSNDNRRIKRQATDNTLPPSIPGEILSSARDNLTSIIDCTAAATTTTTNPSATSNVNRKRRIECAFSDDDDNNNNNKTKKYNRKRRDTVVNGKYLVKNVPSSYKVLNEKESKRYKNSHERLKEKIGKVKKKKKNELSEINTLITGTYAAKFPQASEVVMEQGLAIGGAILASELGLGDFSMEAGEFDLGIDNVSIIEPKRTTINNYVRKTACHKIILNGNRMLNSKAVYIATDHGGGVLVKMAFFYDPEEKRIIKINLDFDKSGHDAEDGGKAIKHSMKKYTFSNASEIKFKGGSSDSGGGFTGDAMKKALVEEGLVDPIDYIHVPCTEHNDQTNLRVATINIYGSGNLAARNLMQLLHSYSDIQKNFESKDDLVAHLKSEWKHVRGDETPPRDFLLLMQEPILTRWKTVGDAALYISKYLDVLVSLCISINKSPKEKNQSPKGLAASNFLSLTNEREIIIDLAFFNDFNKEYFEDHFEWNRATDEHIGESGFISHHHLIRYFIKKDDLNTIEEELDNGSIDGSSLVNPVLKSFWKQLYDEYSKATTTEQKEGLERSLKKAKMFLCEFTKSLEKHNKHFASSDLLFLACFGEHETSKLVAQLFQDEQSDPPDGTFQSPIHKRNVDLPSFYSFLQDYCSDNVADAKKTKNYELTKDAITAVAHCDIWDGSEVMKTHRTVFLENFAALPSTSVWVERSVKKAKLCQCTGKEERNVTVYCIAGDDINDICPCQIVKTTYPERMKEKKEKQIAKAISEGRNPRSMKKYSEDKERGPSLTRNILNYAYKLQQDIDTMRNAITEKEYKNRFDITEKMLSSLPLQGTFARYNERLLVFEASRTNEHKPTAREKEVGVDVQPMVEGLVLWKQLKKVNNEELVQSECQFRQIDTTNFPRSSIWTKMKEAIQKQESNHWIANNPNTTIPDNMKKPNCFRNLSGVEFKLSDK